MSKKTAAKLLAKLSETARQGEGQSQDEVLKEKDWKSLYTDQMANITNAGIDQLRINC